MYNVRNGDNEQLGRSPTEFIMINDQFMQSSDVSGWNQQVAVMEEGGGGEGEPPERLVSDYVELGCLVVMFIMGAPINLAACTEMRRKCGTTRLDLLKRHLNYSDLLMLFVFVPSRVCWLITYEWRGGDLLCKLVKFAQSLTLQINSNVIVCIALDRLFWVLWPLRNLGARHSVTRTRAALAVAWLLAIALSAPQLYLWRTFEVYPRWYQCMQMWQITTTQHRQNFSVNTTITTTPDHHPHTDVLVPTSQEQLYTAIHGLFPILFIN